MFQAFVVVLREGFEAFLIVAIILAYLRKIRRSHLIPAVYWGIGGSVAASSALGVLLYLNANEPLWEGIFGVIAAVLVAWLVVHMWRTAPHLKQDVESHLAESTVGQTPRRAYLGVFLFTVLMISREGMETALLLIQIHHPWIVAGVFLGVAASAGLALLWTRFSRLINLKLFFQVTSVFLLLLVFQILVSSFHEFTEAGVLPQSEALHLATEPFSSEGVYGKWFSWLSVGLCTVWLFGAWLFHRFSQAGIRELERVS